jgi:hypothetical protein
LDKNGASKCALSIQLYAKALTIVTNCNTPNVLIGAKVAESNVQKTYTFYDTIFIFLSRTYSYQTYERFKKSAVCIDMALIHLPEFYENVRFHMH